ncbi:strawberry notch family protein [Eilatimonas milleporae]|uniref:Strawberry notch-like protein n=1 Tax=Eilatimonas milleporae TaxID=911205 RepID=A0A3M0CHA9_9PROT|nr:strawberry notch family protein [Eilatimonas milleporae]RMB09024.1 strawberry notch-like protein [Eilatimonas milleporae]
MPIPRHHPDTALYARDRAHALLTISAVFAERLAQDQSLTRSYLRRQMEKHVGGSDHDGCWSWRDCADAVEAAQTLLYRAVHGALPVQKRLPALAALLNRLPTATHRSEDSVTEQHFGTPLVLAEVAALLLRVPPGATVLEPSAGFGLLASVLLPRTRALVLSELVTHKQTVLKGLFPEAQVFGHDCGSLHDRLDPAIRPTHILMNPPFSSAPGQIGMRDIGVRHLLAALDRLSPGGRLVAIMPGGFRPDNPRHATTFAKLRRKGRIDRFITLYEGLFAKAGTGTSTTLVAIDKTNTTDTGQLYPETEHIDTLDALVAFGLGLVHDQPDPPHAPETCLKVLPVVDPNVLDPSAGTLQPRRKRILLPSRGLPDHRPLEYRAKVQVAQKSDMSDSLYEPYELQAIDIEGAPEHPTPLVQSGALASVKPPRPSYVPNIPVNTIEDKLLSGPQLEAVIYAGEAHREHMPGLFNLNTDKTDIVRANGEKPFRVRRGFAIGDGTGTGKGREIAGIIFDNWTRGRKKAVWVTKSDRLVHAARRDWVALGGDPATIVNLSKYQNGEKIGLTEGILFTTYARLRSASGTSKTARLDQITDWLGTDFDGVIAFDESHEMGNAAPGKSDFMDTAQQGSQQGLSGLALQARCPDARVVYASATIATKVVNMAFAVRLGLWGTDDIPFHSREDFMSAMQEGGLAALELVCRDLKASGLYMARTLSFAGVTYEIVECALTPDQAAIYNAFADAYEIIHHNLQDALRETNVMSDGKALNAQAKGAALSTFESVKQRLFNHLLISMATPMVIKRIEKDITNGHAVVIQIVSTGEALMDRRLAHIAPEDRYDIQVDVTPREYMIDYLKHSFPIHLYDIAVDGEGNERSTPARDPEGNLIVSRAAMERRDRMIERLCSLPPVPTALDQLIHHFGTGNIAEITGRSRRIIKKTVNGVPRRILQSRTPQAVMADEDAFMADLKHILIFSDAGGTGASYHADLNCKNQRPRRHYLLEAGWRAANAIQGLGRSHRSNQACPPHLLPVTTNVQGQKRFTSTIVSRLGTLGALTRGQRQTGGQGLFRQEDNLESEYANAALKQFYLALSMDKIKGISLDRFTAMTGLKIVTESGTLLSTLPNIRRFLNRLLALRIETQNILFEQFTNFIAREVAAAEAKGIVDNGLTTLNADKLDLLDKTIVYTHPSTGAETMAVRIRRSKRTHPMSLSKIHEILATTPKARMMVNGRSGKAALCIPDNPIMDENFDWIERYRLQGVNTHHYKIKPELDDSHWRIVDRTDFDAAWQDEVAATPEFFTDELYVLTGLLLPIWHKLPEDQPRVVRIQTDDGTRLLGRILSSVAFQQLRASCGEAVDAVSLHRMLLDGTGDLALQNGLGLRRVKHMDRHHLEITGTDFRTNQALKSLGCFTSIIDYRTRCFLPTDESGIEILKAVLERHGLKAVQTLAA